MKNEICPIIEECIFFNKSSFTSDFVEKTYRKMFCSMSIQHKECKRYAVFLETGKQAPEYIVPNSQLSIDEISWKIE